MSNTIPSIRFWDLPNNTDPRWWKDRGMRTGIVHLCILFCTIYSLGYDGSLLTGLQALESWNKQFNHPHGTSLGLIAASYYLPKIPSGFVIAMIIDWYGRKIPLYIGAILMLAGAIGCGLANTVPQLIGGRILLGVGTAFAQITACALVPELAHPRIRAVANSFLNVTYFIGSIFASWLTFAMVYYPKPESSWSWRIPALVQGFGPIILAVGVWFVPQSPRWLVKKGRVDEAHEILAKYHANDDLNDDLVLFELRQIQAGVDIEKINDSSSWLSWFRTPGNRRRLLVIFLLGTSTQWLGNVIGYFLVPVLKQVGITSSSEQAGINGGISIWSWWSAIAGALTAERFGRRRLFLCSLFGCLVSFAFITGFSGGYARTKQPSVGVAIVPFLFLFHSAYAVAFTPLPMMYTPEIVPFALRAKAASLLLFFQNCAQSFNQYVNPVALDAIGWKYFLVWIGANIFYIITFWLFIKETKGLTVEEAAVLYDPEYVRHATMEEERRLHQSHAFEAKYAVSGETKEDVEEVKA